MVRMEARLMFREPAYSVLEAICMKFFATFGQFFVVFDRVAAVLGLKYARIAFTSSILSVLFCSIKKI